MLTTSQFLDHLTRSNLLPADLLASLNGNDPQAIATSLINRNLLTRWQANQLLSGNHRLFLGKYKLLAKLGEGGMGAVYQAEQHPLGRIVAIKLMSDKVLKDPDAVARFRREMQTVAALDHPNIVRALDADTIGNRHFLVMEYVQGDDVKKYVTEHGQLPIDWSCEVVRQAAIGLQHAWERGIVHRDIKPPNLLVVEGDGSIPQVRISRNGRLEGLASPSSPRKFSTAASSELAIQCRTKPFHCPRCPSIRRRLGNVSR